MDVQSTWKQGWVTNEEYGNTAQPCTDGVGKDKAQPELKVIRNTQENKSLSSYINSELLNRETVSSLVNRLGGLLTGGADTADVLNVFTSVFTRKVS